MIPQERLPCDDRRNATRGTFQARSCGEQDLDTILVGSVAERVVRGATCAVLVVKTDTHRRAA